jgi:hypothetical protein
MDLSELLEEETKDLIIIYPGRFHPFHIGHGKVYQYLKRKYPNAQVFISTSDKTDGDRSPFTFEEKKKMMMLAGVDSGAIRYSKSPYQSVEITSNFDENKTVVVFVVSEKDMEEEPRFDFSNGISFKKNGEPAYLQKWGGLDSAETFGTHGYIATSPTFKFKVRGEEINSASQIRNLIANSDDTELSQILQDLYNITDIPTDVIEIFKRKIGNKETMNENWSEYSLSEFLIEIEHEEKTMKKGILKSISEGKSPHKKGTKKYNAHMAAIHAESIDEEFDRKVKEIVEAKFDIKESLESVAADMKGYVDDHKEHFDAYPMDIEVDDKIYDWDEYWAILDKVYPDAYDNQYAVEGVVTEASIDDLPQKIKDWLSNYPVGEGEYAFAKGIPNTEANNKIINSIAKIVPIRKRYRAKSKPGYDRPRQYAHKEHADTIALYVRESIEEGSYANEQHEQLEYIHHVLQECGDGNVDNAMVDQAIAFVEDIREQHFNTDGSTKSESVKVEESEERPYICVHAKKGKYETHATSSYDAAKNAAEHWGLKSTAGIDAHLADVEHVAEELDNDTFIQIVESNEMGDLIVLDEDGKLVNRAELLENPAVWAILTKAADLGIKFGKPVVKAVAKKVGKYFTKDNAVIGSKIKTSGRPPRLGPQGMSGQGTSRTTNHFSKIDGKGTPKITDPAAQTVTLPPYLKPQKPMRFNKRNVKEGQIKEWLKEDAQAEEKVSTLTKMQTVYNHNEDRNNHSENILMLAQAFGDRGEIKAIQGLLKTIRQQGYVTPEQSEIMYNSIHKKYIKELFPLNEVWPALAVAGAAGYGLYKGGKAFGKWLAAKHKQIKNSDEYKAYKNLPSNIKKMATRDYNPIQNMTVGEGYNLEAKSVDIMQKAMEQSIDEDDSWKLGPHGTTGKRTAQMKAQAQDDSWKLGPHSTTGKRTAQMKAQAQDDSWKLTGTDAMRDLWYGPKKPKSVAKGTGKHGPANRYARANTGPGDKTHLKKREIEEGPGDKTQLKKRAAKQALAKQTARDSGDFPHDSPEYRVLMHKSQQAGVRAATDNRSDRKGVVATAKAVAQQNAVKKANKQNKAADAKLVSTPPFTKTVAKGTGAKGPAGGATAPVSTVAKPGRVKMKIKKSDLFGKGSSKSTKPSDNTIDWNLGYDDEFGSKPVTGREKILKINKKKTNIPRDDIFKGADLGHKGNWVESILHYSDAKGTAKYSEGYKAAKDGVKYEDNPYSGAEKLQWSKGHNDFRADKLRAAGEPNYGARGQFENKR